MPELPEVEIARENLERWIGNRRILDARVLDSRMLRGQKARKVESTLRGAQVREVSRRGKYLIWDLGKRGKVAAHFGMSGKFVIRGASEPIAPSVRVLLRLAQRRKLALVDPRDREARSGCLAHVRAMPCPPCDRRAMPRIAGTQGDARPT